MKKGLLDECKYSFTVSFLGKRYIFFHLKEAKETKNGFLELLVDTSQDTQWPYPFFRGENYLLFLYVENFFDLTEVFKGIFRERFSMGAFSQLPGFQNILV